MLNAFTAVADTVGSVVTGPMKLLGACVGSMCRCDGITCPYRTCPDTDQRAGACCQTIVGGCSTECVEPGEKQRKCPTPPFLEYNSLATAEKQVHANTISWVARSMYSGSITCVAIAKAYLSPITPSPIDSCRRGTACTHVKRFSVRHESHRAITCDAFVHPLPHPCHKPHHAPHNQPSGCRERRGRIKKSQKQARARECEIWDE